jgi:glyoxylate reductase
MAKPIVFVARRIPELGLKLIAEHAEIRMHEGSMPPSRQELKAGVKDCDGILSLLSDRIDAEVLDAAGANLKVVSNFAVGYNNIDVAEVRRRGIAVGNTPGVLTEATADIAVALLLGAARRIPEGWQAVRELQWKTWEPLGWIGQDLVGKTLGIVGMGRIGAAVAKRLYGGWGMRVLYTARNPKPEVDLQFDAEHVALDKLLEESDFVSIHVPMTVQTRKLIGARELGLMKSTAILINTARGEVLDQVALYDALKNNGIFAAGLDVCEPEPLPSDSPLRSLTNCLVVPHIGSATVTARNAMAERSARNLIAGIQGVPLPFEVTQ